MQHHLYWSVLPVVGGEDKVLESVKNILRPYVKDIVNRIKFELTDGESGLDDDEIKDIIHSLFEGPMYWDDFEKVPSKSEVYKIFTPYIKVDLDGIFFRQQMDSSSLSEDTSFLLLSSDSNQMENQHCEVMEFLTAVLAPLMTTNQSIGGWTSFSNGKLLGAGSYAFDKDGVEVPIQRLANSYFSD